MIEFDKAKYSDLSAIIQSIFTLGQCNSLNGATLAQEDICEYVEQILEVFDYDSKTEET
jgi:hypothetical protein